MENDSEKTSRNVLRLAIGDWNSVSPAATRLTYRKLSTLRTSKTSTLPLHADVGLWGWQDPDCQAKANPSASVAALRDEPHEALFFDQPVEIGGKRGRRIDVAQQEGALTELEIAALARQVRRSTREAYYAVAYRAAESEKAGAHSGVAKRLAQIAEDRFKTGDVAQLEVIQTGLEVSRAEADLQVARQREKVSMSQLNALLNESASKAWELAGTLEDNTPRRALDDLISRAYQSNPDLQPLGGEKKR